jgi:hypothetical protein
VHLCTVITIMYSVADSANSRTIPSVPRPCQHLHHHHLPSTSPPCSATAATRQQHHPSLHCMGHCIIFANPGAIIFTTRTLLLLTSLQLLRQATVRRGGSQLMNSSRHEVEPWRYTTVAYKFPRIYYNMTFFLYYKNELNEKKKSMRNNGN